MSADDELVEAGNGSYGLRFPDLRTELALLVPSPNDWRPWRIVRRRGPGELVDGAIGHDFARLRLAPEGSLVIDRGARTSVFTMPDPPTDAELVHPYIAATAAIAARWDGRQSFHAGGFVVAGAAWGVLGEREVGKSTLLASLAQLGVPVLCDDVLVVKEGMALAGPRCIDLREPAARTLGWGHEIGLVGTRERWRITLPRVPAEVPLAGWVTLAWGEAIGFAQVKPSERFPRLLDNLTVILEPPDPPAVLALATLPMLTLARPRRLDTLPATAEALVTQLERVGALRGDPGRL
ncbi:MAG: hypothetical protein JO130_01790 [Solirubrobacterales bacterium]|nr:hypothetical protein [Solirubrobacterales bacterium]